MTSWSVAHDGRVLGPGRTQIGYFDVNGDVYLPQRLDALGNPYGAPPNANVGPDGTVVIETTAIVGQVDQHGTVVDVAGLTLATVSRDGGVHDPAGQPIGFVDPQLHGEQPQPGQPTLPARAAAAVVLVIVPA